MPLDVSTTRIPQRGLPPGVAVAAFAVVLGAIVGIGLFARPAQERPIPTIAAVVPPTASPSTSPTANSTRPPTPRPTEMPPCAASPLPAVVAAAPPAGRRLQPTGIETVTTEPAGIRTLVADRDGSLWAFGTGHLTHLDSSGTVRTWTFSDDEAFDAAGIASAVGGGVWLYGPTGLSWFDGSELGNVLPLPEGTGDVASAAEAPDGALWVATWSGELWRWDGRKWEAAFDCAGAFGQIRALAIDADGDLWVSTQTSEYGAYGSASLARFDGTRWWHYTNEDTPSLGNQVLALEPASDGAMWVGSDAGVTRFDETAFATSFPITPSAAIAIAPLEDGSAWVVAVQAGGWGPMELSIVRVGDALPPNAERELRAPGSAYPWAAALRETRGGLFLATQDSFARLVNDRWAPVVPVIGPPWIGRVIALSASDALYIGGDVIREVSGSGSGVLSGGDSIAGAGALARDGRGRVWAASADGARVYANGKWQVIPEGSGATSVAVGPDGTAWFGMPGGDVVRVSFDGTNPRAEQLPPSGLDDVQSIAVAQDGTVWAGWCACDGSGSAGLARFNGRAWVPVHLVAKPTTIGTNDIAAAPNGDVWAVLAEQPSGRTFVGRLHAGRWTIHDVPDGVPEAAGSIAIGPDGAVWVGGSGIGRFDGRRWSTRFVGHGFWSISIAPDGTMWAAGPSGLHRLIAPS